MEKNFHYSEVVASEMQDFRFICLDFEGNLEV